MPFTMERREHYDPEDIERLLQERSFDQLLEEERAYVLRHLESRDEYEAMRALLHQVRDDDQPAVQADADAREKVMRAYRQEHRPQWQIWLNSIAALLRPQEGMAMPFLRPAIAIASLALLVTAGVWVMKQSSVGEGQPLAELNVKPVAADESAEPPSSAELEPGKDGLTSTVADEESIDEARRAATGATRSDAVRIAADEADTQEPTTDALAEAAGQVAEDAPGGTKEGKTEEVSVKVMEKMNEQVTIERDMPRREAAAASAPISHVVTEAELTRNYSMANATGKVTVVKNATAAPAMTRNLAETPELIALIATGW
jgi:hypothetical protein